jgi:hypothetical protein
MKKWSSAKYYREHEGRPIELGGRVKGCFKKEKEGLADTPTKSINGNLKNGINDSSRQNLNKKDKAVILAKHMKQYDSLKLEAARLERDAQRVNLENAVIEGERLKKEAAILDVELDTMRIDLAIKREEASKCGIIIQNISGEEDIVKEKTTPEVEHKSVHPPEGQSVVQEITNIEEPLQLPAKRTRR